VRAIIYPVSTRHVLATLRCPNLNLKVPISRAVGPAVGLGPAARCKSLAVTQRKAMQARVCQCFMFKLSVRNPCKGLSTVGTPVAIDAR
jgi:hypothetical protein